MLKSFLYGICVGAVFMAYWYNWGSTDVRLAERIEGRYAAELQVEIDEAIKTCPEGKSSP